MKNDVDMLKNFEVVFWSWRSLLKNDVDVFTFKLHCFRFYLRDFTTEIYEILLRDFTTFLLLRIKKYSCLGFELGSKYSDEFFNSLKQWVHNNSNIIMYWNTNGLLIYMYSLKDQIKYLKQNLRFSCILILSYGYNIFIRENNTQCRCLYYSV